MSAALKIQPEYQIVDVTVVSCDGRHATGDIVYQDHLGRIHEFRAEYRAIGRVLQVLQNTPATEIRLKILTDEGVLADFREACAYARDVLRGKN